MRRPPMTQRAQRALSAACRVAREHGLSFVGTDALLYAVLEAEHALLDRLDGRERLQREIAAVLESGPGTPSKRELQLSPRAREALQAADSEARALGAGATDLDHIVLGLLCAKHKGLAGLILEQYGLAADELRSALRGLNLREARITAPSRPCPRCKRKAEAWRAVLGRQTLCRRCFGLDLKRGRIFLATESDQPRELGLFHKN